MSAIINIANDEDAAAASLLGAFGGGGGGVKSILFFWAEWHAPSSPGGPFDTVVTTLARQDGGGGVRFFRVLAEGAPRLSLKHNVTTVPTLLFIDAEGFVRDRIDGGEDVAPVTQFYSKLVNYAASSNHETQQQAEPAETKTKPQNPQQMLDGRLGSLTTSSPVMLFLKGTPGAPRCGFSRQAVEMLTSSGLSFGYFDILGDEEVRQGLKAYSDWPTYPQLYVRGELVGGLDIMKEMAEDEGGLVDQLELGEFVVKNANAVAASDQTKKEEKEENKEEKKEEATMSLDDRLKGLIGRHRVMLFMKGVPSAPRCGFSRQIVEILDSHDASYDAFNILEDDEVRQGLKVYSDWPTYPQLYVEGDLVGGLDIVKEMEEGGDLEDLLTGGSQD